MEAISFKSRKFVVIVAKASTSSINAANISSILPNASLADNVTDVKAGSCDAPTSQAISAKTTSSPMAPSEVSPNTAICDRPKVKSVSKKDCKNNRRLAAAAAAFQSTGVSLHAVDKFHSCLLPITNTFFQFAEHDSDPLDTYNKSSNWNYTTSAPTYAVTTTATGMYTQR